MKLDGNKLLVDDQSISLVSEPDPNKLPWKELEVDLVLECTGRFVDAAAARAHVAAGAKRVIISAPAKGDAKTLVFGVNHTDYDPATDTVVSNGSCTTNCLAPIAKVLMDTFGIERGLMTTIHSYTNDQKVLDLPHPKDLRRARAAAQNMIPTSTGAAKAVAKVLPELEGKFDGMAVRVPTMDVSLVDLSVVTQKPVDVETLDAAMRAAAEGPLKGVLAVADAPLVSSDFIGNPASSVYDAQLTRVQGDKLVKLFSWYDNEWGFANRMIDLAQHIGAAVGGHLAPGPARSDRCSGVENGQPNENFCAFGLGGRFMMGCRASCCRRCFHHVCFLALSHVWWPDRPGAHRFSRP